MPEPIKIGRLRWPVQLLRRSQFAQPGGTGIVEGEDAITVHADLQALGPILFYGGVTASGDKAPTHRAIVRWVDGIDMTYAIRRVTNRPNGTQKTEMFRVRRIMEIEGRKRFVSLELQLETEA
jgi:hypothetical protein